MTDHTQTLERRFSPFSLLSLAFVICQSWLGWSVTFPVALSAGGGPGVFYGYLVSTAACAIVACGLAEQASAFPTSGGQYHAAFMVASPGTRRATSFFTGAFGLVAWALLTVSATIYVAQIIMALASFSHPDFVPARWQTTLVFFAVQAACAAIPCLFARLLPRLETFWFWSSILGAGAGLVVLLATGCGKGGRGDARTVFAEHENRTGWPDGLAFLLGVGQAMYPYLGIDAATHISEEVHRPERVVPRVIGLTILIGFVTAVPFVLAILLSATDLSAVAASLVPLLTAFRQATGSPAASKFYVTWVLVNYFGASMSCMTTTGRLAWSFARDGGLPCSPALSAVHPALGMPVHATAASCVFCMLYGLIYIGSSVAFNGFVASAVLAMHVSYAIPQATALVRGRRETLPPGRPVDLGVFGWFCNAFTVGWVALYAVLFCFPLRLPVEAGSMNYVSVVVVGVAVALCGMWFVGGKRETYIGPAADLVAEMSRASMDQTLSEGIRDDADVHASK